MAMKLPAMIFVQNYIERYQLPIELANSMLKSESDCEEFHSGFYHKNKRVSADLHDYREYKIAKQETTLNEFLQRCQGQEELLQDVFESVFIQRFSTTDIDVILSAILNGVTSFETLFLNFKENPNKNILQYVL